MKRIWSLAVILGGILLDQLLKIWTVTHVAEGQTNAAISGLFSWTYVKNSGAAWSILEGKQWLFMIITPIIVVVAAYFLYKKRGEAEYCLALALILAGALGNYIDRVRLGYVVDMISLDFVNFPIFNLADSLLSVGVIVLFYAILTDKSQD